MNRPGPSGLLNLGVLGTAVLLPLLFWPPAAGPFETPKIRLFQIGTLTAGLLLPAVLWGSGRARARLRAAIRSLLGPLALMAAAVAISLLFSRAPALGLWGRGGLGLSAAGMVGVALVWLALWVVLLESEAALARTGRWLVIGSVPILLYATFQYLGSDPLQWVSTSVSPVQGTLGRSSFLGGYLALLLPIGLFLTAREKGVARRPLRAILLWQGVMLLLTLSRAGWVAGAAGVSVWAWLALARPLPRVGIALAAVVAATAGLLLLVDGGGGLIRGTIPAEQVELVREDSNEARLALVVEGLALWLERPWVGHGPAVYPLLYEKNPSAVLQRAAGAQPTDPHSWPLILLIEYGLGLATAVAWGGVSVWRRLRRAAAAGLTATGRNTLAALSGSLAAGLVYGFLSPLTSVAYAFALIALAGLIAWPAWRA